MSDNGHITWTNDKRKLADLVPWDHNPRQIDKAEVVRLGDSLAEFGQIQTIAVGPNDEIYDGHQRRAVWALLPQFGPEHLVDVRVASRPLTDKERQKLVVYLHRGTAGTWDWDELANSFEVPDLLEWGFEESELQLDWGDDATPDPGAQVDKAAELQEKWQVERGQVWQVGRHRVMCGDSTCAEDVGRLMGGERAAMVFMDPPYNVAYQDNESIESLKARNRRTDGLTVSNDAMTDEEFDTFLDSLLSAWPLQDGGAFYLGAPPGRPETQFRNALDRVSGLTLRQCIVWVKDRFVFGRQDYHWRHESILYGWRDGAAHYFIEDHTQNTVWEFKRPTTSKQHPTMKPVDLPVKAISNSSRSGEPIWDGCLGSGTTLVACEQTNRIGYGMEIEPRYVAVTLERLTGMGLEAVLVDD